MEQIIFGQEQARYEISGGALSIGLAMVGPTLMVWGTPEQQDRFIEPMLRGDEMWCQLFSEPGAGSDLPSLITRAERDGDVYVVNGQKVWTTMAQYSDWAILLARTDRETPGRRGISYLLLDMRTPGVDVRPLRQATGVAHFNEVFLSDVRIPVENLVGPEGEGWKVARTTLTSERMLIGGGAGTTFDDVAALGACDGPDGRRGPAPAGGRGLRRLRAPALSRTPRPDGREPRPGTGRRGVVAEAGDVAPERAAGQPGARAARAGRPGDGPPATGPVGIDGIACRSGLTGFWQDRFLGQWSTRIGGGTDEIQRNQIAERVLGLPRDPV